MSILKKKILTFLMVFIGIVTYGQKINKSDLTGTWKLIKKKPESNENKIDIGKLVIYDENGNIDKSATEDRKNDKSNDDNIYIQIERDFITQYLFGDAYRYKYTLQNNTIRLGQYELNIVKLTEKSLILGGEKELKFKKFEINLNSYNLYKDKEPIYGLFNPLILFSYPNG